MRRSVFSSLRSRLLLLVLLAVIPALALMVSTAAEQRRLAARETQAEGMRIVQSAAAEYERLLDGARQLLTVLARLPGVRAQRSDRMTRLFAELLREYPFYQNIGAARRDGTVFASALPLPDHVGLADRSYFQRALSARGFAVGDYQIGRITGKATVNVGYPVLDAAGQVQAVLFVALDLGWLNQLAARAQLPSGSTLLLIDQNGTVLARYPSPETWVARVARDEPLIRTVLARGRGTIETPGLDGRSRFYAFAPLSPGPGAGSTYLTVGVPAEVAYAQADRMLVRNLVLLSLVGMLALFVAWYGGDLFILRRVRALVRAAKGLRAGDLSVRTGLKYETDELGRLARAFDEMAGSLERVTGRYELILTAAGEGIVGADREGKIVFANPAAAQVLGYAAQELIGQDAHALIHLRPDGSRNAESECSLSSVLRDGVVRHVSEALFSKRDGTSFPVEYTASPVREHGIIVGVVLVFKDVTEQKRAEAAVEAARQRALQAEVDEKEFCQGIVSALSHGKFRLVDPGEIPTEGELQAEFCLSEAASYSSGRKRLQEIAEGAGMAPEVATDLVLAAGEAITNAIKHAVGGHCAVYTTPDRVIVRVCDRGTGIRLRDLPGALFQAGFSTQVSLGMGYTLMLELLDQLWLATGPDGTVVQLEKWIHPEEHPSDTADILLARFSEANVRPERPRHPDARRENPASA